MLCCRGVNQGECEVQALLCKGAIPLACWRRTPIPVPIAVEVLAR